MDNGTSVKADAEAFANGFTQNEIDAYRVGAITVILSLTTAVYIIKYSCSMSLTKQLPVHHLITDFPVQ